MPRSTWIADVLADELRGDPHVDYRVRDGWSSRGYSTAEHVGVMDHDTGSQVGSKYTGVLGWVERNSPIAPLCNIITGPAGWGGLGSKHRVDVVAAGKTNHGGRPDDTWDPFDAWLTDQANRKMIGVEHLWYPGMSWDDSYIELQLRIDAALLEHMGRGAHWQVDHKEYATLRKHDRRLIDDNAAYRRRLQQLLDARKEDIMATLDELRTVVREEARAAVEDRWADRKFKNWVDGEIEPVRVTLHSIRRDSSHSVPARLAAEQALALVKELAARGGLSDVDVAHIEAIVEDTLRDATIVVADNDGG